MIVTIDRGDYFQYARVIEKGAADRMRAAVIRLLQAIPALQAFPARLLGLGVRREHIRSPDASRQA